MIQSYTRLHVADNSGARRIRLINIPGSSRRKYASVGDIIVCTVREAIPNSPVRKGSVVKAVVVRQAAPLLRPDGTYIKFDDNAAVLINAAPASSARWPANCGTRVSCGLFPSRRRWCDGQDENPPRR